MGMSVKVVDEKNMTFAVAIIHVINSLVKLGDTQFGDTHVGILIVDFIEGATQDHLRHRDCLKAWRIDHLIAADGKLLSYHNDRQSDVGSLSQGSGKRSYVHVTRKRKIESSNVTKRDNSLSKEGVLKINTEVYCSERCCQYFDRDLALTIRKKWWEKSFRERRMRRSRRSKCYIPWVW